MIQIHFQDFAYVSICLEPPTHHVSKVSIWGTPPTLSAYVIYEWSLMETKIFDDILQILGFIEIFLRN